MALLGLLALLTVVRSEKDMNFVEEEVSQEQIQYFKEIFMQYDENMDGLISMEENLKQDKVIAEEQGKPFDEAQSRNSFERADLDKDGFVSLEEMTAPRSPEEQCQQLYGDFAEFDGVKSCKCVKGYTADVNGTCIVGSHEVCASQFGPSAEFDGINNCQCKKGFIPDPSGKCITGVNSTCQEMYGPLAMYEPVNNTCTCQTGSVPDSNGTCVEANDTVCQQWFGPNTAFNGKNSCVCKKGFVYADGECFRGSNKICGSIIAGSRFDGNNECVCRKGYEVDPKRAICIKVKTESGQDPVKPPPKQGTISITLVEAKHLPKMDLHTKCDPFVIVKLGDTSKKSKVVKKTYNPKWDQSFVLTYNETQTTPTNLIVEVWDWDRVGNGEFVGKVELLLSDLMEEEVSGLVDLRNEDGALVRGQDRKISAIHLQVSMTDKLPYVPFWEPLLEEKPEWVLEYVRIFAALWSLLGVVLWTCLRPRSPEIKPKTE